MSSAGGGRAVSEVVAVVLLVGLVLLGAVFVATVYGDAVDELTGQTADETVESRLQALDGEVESLGEGGDPATVPLPDAGTAAVDDDGARLSLSVNDGACTASIDPGRVEYGRDGTRVLYAAGGVWRAEGDGGAMVTPPAVAYRSGAVEVGVPRIEGVADGGDLAVRRRDDGGLAAAFEDCERLESMTFTVHDSPVYEAWARYLREEFPGQVTVDDAARTVRLRLTDPKLDLDPATGEVTSETTTFDATVTVRRLQLSATANGALHYPAAAVTVAENGSTRTPWPDGDPGDALASPLAADMNAPGRPDGVQHTFADLRPGTTLRVDARTWRCGDWRTVGSTTVDGTTYDQRRCDGVAGDWVRVDGHDAANRLPLRSGDPLPRSVPAVGPAQQPLYGALGGLFDDGRVIVPPRDNTVVFVYELTRPDADRVNASAPGDPDYNDLVVVVRLDHADHPSRIPVDHALGLDLDTVPVEVD